MKKISDAPSSGGPARPGSESVIYIVPPESMQLAAPERLRLLDLWNIFWAGKWFIVLTTALFAVASVIVALSATEWYRVDVLLAPADERSAAAGIAGQLGGLSSLVGLAGISVGGGGNAEAIAVLKSRRFTQSFIEDNNLLPLIFADVWDPDKEAWRSSDPDDQPDVRDAIRRFDEEIRLVSEDARTNLVTLSIEWTDPEVAANWANSLTARLNQFMRQRALREAGANIEFLEAELSDTSVATLRQSIGRLLEAELQKLMLARGNEEFAFRVIDPATVPKYRSSPKRTILVLIATAVGGLFAICVVLGRHHIRQSAFSGSVVRTAYASEDESDGVR